MTSPEVLPDAVVAAFGESGVLLVMDPGVLAGGSVDWTGHWSGRALGAVRPRSTAQVAAVLRACHQHGVPVQVQGGNTGLVGASVPADAALLLRTDGLDRVDPVDVLERSVVVGAGVTAARIADHARASGLRFGVDLAARESATVGGMVATNAGGLGVCAYGMMRDQLRGLVAVLADGRVVGSTGRPRKDNCGYDFTGLLAGSEGTLGVITEVEVGLHALPPRSTVALLALDHLAGAVLAARRVQAEGWLVTAAEVVDRAGAARAAQVLGVADPLRGGAAWLLLLEVADGATAEGLAAVSDEVVAVAVDPSERGRLWELRERQSDLYTAVADVEKFDVSVRLSRLDALVADVRRVVTLAAAGGTVGFFGHALDGNLHVQVVGAGRSVTGEVLAAVAGLGGSISAEHGIGRQKAAYLHLARSPEHIAWMRAIKSTVDPDGLLNQGVLLAEIPDGADDGHE